MEKRKLIKVVKILTSLTTIITLISAGSGFLIPMYVAYKLHVAPREAASIGIIGGADGPTAIYVTSQSSSHLITIIFASLTIAGIVYLILDKKAAR